MKPAPPLEREVQRAILKRVRQCFPQVFLVHIPNGARSGGHTSRKIAGGIAAADGAIAGFPDLLALWNGGALLLEVKRPNLGTVSTVQKAVHERLSTLGWPVSIVTSQDEASEALRAAGAPCVEVPDLRARFIPHDGKAKA